MRGGGGRKNTNLGNSNTERVCSLVVIVVCGECGDDGVVVRFFKDNN